ncbi:glutathione S-transferase 2-like [Anticarsia gemmatalis]|uniref:glutathione S-transferase 2-like n=1 Tax=Anticarsia gemmatalis TaxID=129554 RepID=UPI003F758D36
MPDKVIYYYFDEKAFGEAIRLLLAYGGQEYEDRRINFDTEWADFKKNAPFGTLPLLIIDGKEFSTSLAISRYLGNKYGLAGDNAEEAFEIDQNMDYLHDLRSKASAQYWEEDEAIKKSRQEEYAKSYPVMLEKLNDIVQKNNGHIALGKLTWGDFSLAGAYDYLKLTVQIPDLDERYPALKAAVDKVYSIPQVKAYADAAPKTNY